jgi:hypothetical protein
MSREKRIKFKKFTFSLHFTYQWFEYTCVLSTRCVNVNAYNAAGKVSVLYVSRHAVI